MCAKIIIKRTKDLNYFSLCALNLFNTRVSQFDNFSMAFKFIDMHLYVYIYIYIYIYIQCMGQNDRYLFYAKNH